MVTADHVAHAIVAACRETGADPITVITNEPHLQTRDAIFAHSRARTYAAFALDEVFGRSDDGPSRPQIATMVGVARVSKDAYFASFEIRRAAVRWWDEALFRRVIAAIEAVGRPPVAPREPPASETRPKPPMRPVAQFRAGGGVLEPGGYRPPAGTIAAILDDDAGADRPVFDKGRIGADRKPQQIAATGKRSLYDELRRAVENTAKMTPPPEE